MRLSSFLIENYRSISNEKRVPLSNQSIILGPNNEGKSNILRALRLAFDSIAAISARFRFHGRFQRQTSLGADQRRNIFHQATRATKKLYDWNRDFPVFRQTKNYKKAKRTQVSLEFELLESEMQSFRDLTGVNLNSNLILKVEFGRDGLEEISVVIPGPGKRRLDEKIIEICTFVSRHIEFHYFPSIRTASAANKIVSQSVIRHLEELDDEEIYAEFMDKMNALYQPTLDELSKDIENTLKDFVPSVRGASIRVDLEKGLDAIRSSVSVVVDDGVETPIDSKGDGIQSLASLALMKHAATLSSKKGQIVLAIEEPEAHLHPDAIHQIGEIIERLSGDGQVVITTHCPLLIDRLKVNSNIIVKSSNVKAAKSIEEIRDVLGVRVGDDLRSAQMVVFVEGESDRIIIERFFQEDSPLSKALRAGVISFETLHGASTLSAKAQLYKSMLCEPFAFIDNDKAGRAGIERAVKNGSIDRIAIRTASVTGQAESEIEDLIDEQYWKDFLQQKIGVSTGSVKKKFSGKWTSQLRLYLDDSGIVYDDHRIEEIKIQLAESIRVSRHFPLDKQRGEPLQSFAHLLRTQIS